MSSRRPKPTPSRRSLGGQLGLLLAINALPLAAMAWIGWRFWTGELKLSRIGRNLPPGIGENLLVMLGIFGVLIALVGVPLAVLNVFLRRLELRGILSVVHWDRLSAVGKTREAVLWLPRTAVYVVLWVLRLAVILAIVAALGLMVVFVVRLMRPEFGNDWLPIERLLAKIR